jgi:hypothetical protein
MTQTPAQTAPPTQQSLCAVLAGQPERIAWETLTADEWRTLTQAAARHGVAPLLWHHAQQGTWAAQMPAAAHQDLRRAYYTTTAQNTMLYHELGRILAALEGIPVVVLKGAALAATLYPQIGLRPMGDIDVLVAPDRLLEMVPRMQRLGYRVLSIQHHLVFYNSAYDGPDLETHWTFAYTNPAQHPLLNEWLWQTAVPFTTPHLPASSTVYQLSPTAQIVTLVGHLTIHHGLLTERLLWLYDLHLLLTDTTHPVDWDALQRVVHTLGWQQALGAVLGTLQRLFGTPLDNCPLPLEPLSRSVAALRVGHDAIGREGKGDPSVWKTFRVLPWSVRLRLLPLLVFPSRMHIRRRHHLSAEQPLLWYYVRRWLDLLGGGLRTIHLLIVQRKHTP